MEVPRGAVILGQQKPNMPENIQLMKAVGDRNIAQIYSNYTMRLLKRAVMHLCETTDKTPSEIQQMLMDEVESEMNKEANTDGQVQT